MDLRLSTKIRSPWDAVMDTSRSRKLGNPLVRVGRSTLHINQSYPRPRMRTQISVCSSSTRPQEWELWGFGWTVRCDLNSTRSETATLDPKNLNFMDLTTCSRIFWNPSVAYPTILAFMLIDNTKPLNPMKMDFATCIRFHRWINEVGFDLEQLPRVSVTLKSNENR